MTWRTGDRAEEPRQEAIGVPDERPDEPPIRTPVATEAFRRRLDRSLHQDRSPAVEGMPERCRRFGELEASTGKIEIAEEGRHDVRPHDRRADVVDEPRQRQLGRADTPAGRLVRLEDADRESGPGEGDGRRETVQGPIRRRGRRPLRSRRHQRRSHERGWLTIQSVPRMLALFTTFRA